jgi:uncharacterized protein
MNEYASILWRRLDRPGHEAARLRPVDLLLWQLDGASVFEYEGQSCRLNYVIACDQSWTTVSADVTGWVGKREVDVRIRVLEPGVWQLNGADCPQVNGCKDVDLNFSPSTNLLPIRRLNLSVGEGAKVRAAWLRFPTFTLEPLEQVYQRASEQSYRYESGGGKFVADLRVDRSGFVVEYGNFWSAESITS